MRTVVTNISISDGVMNVTSQDLMNTASGDTIPTGEPISTPTVLADVGGGGTPILAVTGDPTGVTAAKQRQLGYDVATHSLWMHEGADDTNTSWFPLIQP